MISGGWGQTIEVQRWETRPNSYDGGAVAYTICDNSDGGKMFYRVVYKLKGIVFCDSGECKLCFLLDEGSLPNIENIRIVENSFGDCE